MSLVGGWSEFRPLTAEDKKVFDEATQGLVGVRYEPLMVSTQIVAGTNYKYMCNAYPVIAEPIVQHKMVQIFAPLSGTPHIVSITNL